MASSHSGEDVHVRTLAALYRRAGVSQSVLACGTEGMPLDTITAQRLARDGERPGPLRHMCSGQHTAFVLHSKLRGWTLETLLGRRAPVPGRGQARGGAGARRGARQAQDRRSTAAGCRPSRCRCRPPRARSRSSPTRRPSPSPIRGPRSPSRSMQVRDAMLAHPDLVGGTRDRLDTSLMKAAPGRLVSKGGMGALRAVGVLPHGRQAAAGLALKLEDGDGHQHAMWAASVEALVAGRGTRCRARSGCSAATTGRRASIPHGRTIAESVAKFDLAPVRELIS